ncbi:hypothetical protein GCM10011415_22600 [Salipiger pallidus]|uniref:Uncharacterized protein n=1 Tax=Salipiger pallidus TaxID=1775170 RepID=A0A8J2ZK21_9RHOB|nr:hypothetical protein GCM10011415_22600 [Salipiger pallidus]
MAFGKGALDAGRQFQTMMQRNEAATQANSVRALEDAQRELQAAQDSMSGAFYPIALWGRSSM